MTEFTVRFWPYAEIECSSAIISATDPKQPSKGQLFDKPHQHKLIMESKMRLIASIIFIALLSVSCTRTDAPANSSVASRLVGTWDLVEFDRRDDSGKVAESYYGNSPLGVLVYTASGDMSVHLVDRRVGEFESGDFMLGSPEEIKEAYEGYFGYFGRYSVDVPARTVTHHVEGSSFRGYTGSDMTRFFKLDGDTLSLVSGVEIEAGVPSTFHLVWRRRN